VRHIINGLDRQGLALFSFDGDFWVTFLLGTPLQDGSLPRRATIGPGRFHQHPTNMTVAGLGDATARLCPAARCSLGTTPRYAISCGALAKRLKSPISAMIVVAVSRFTLRKATNTLKR
jgi:hypothetical protein